MKIMVTEQNVSITILGNVKIHNDITEKSGSCGEVRLGEICVKSFIFYSREPNNII